MKRIWNFGGETQERDHCRFWAYLAGRIVSDFRAALHSSYRDKWRAVVKTVMNRRLP